MAEEVHSSVSGLTALRWETAKMGLNHTALLLGEGRLAGIFSSFDIFCSALERE